MDVDEDGRDDVIFGMQSDAFPSSTVASEDEMKKRCLVASMYKRMSHTNCDNSCNSRL